MQEHGWELALACIMICIHLETGPRRVAKAKAGTREQGRELALAYMWQIHMQTGPRVDAEAIAGTVQIHCGRGMILIVGALVTWAIYTQEQLLLCSSLIITSVVPG